MHEPQIDRATGDVRPALATPQRDVVRLVAATTAVRRSIAAAAMREHRFDFLSKTISQRTRARESFEELMPGTGGRNVRGISVSVREAFITPRKIKEKTK